jgi:peroxiredoxin
MLSKKLDACAIGTVALLLAVLATGLWVSFTYARHPDRLQGQHPQIGVTAPAIEAVNSQGDKVSLSDYHGKVVVVHFWASWCGPCVKEMPLIHRLYEDSGSEVEVLFVNAGEAKGTIQAYLAENEFDFPVLTDVTGRIAQAYAVTGLPATYVINPQGKMAQAILGEISNEQQLAGYMKDARGD